MRAGVAVALYLVALVALVWAGALAATGHDWAAGVAFIGATGCTALASFIVVLLFSSGYRKGGV